MNKRSKAVGLILVVGVNVYDGATDPYLVPDDSPVADYLASMERNTPAVVQGGSNTLTMGTRPFSIG